jgi:hypothetical protein
VVRVTTVNVNKRYEISIGGTEEQYIALGDSLFSGGLDSMDAGDATGAFIAYAEQDGNTIDSQCFVSGHGCWVIIEIILDAPFTWVHDEAWKPDAPASKA